MEVLEVFSLKQPMITDPSVKELYCFRPKDAICGFGSFDVLWGLSVESIENIILCC